LIAITSLAAGMTACSSSSSGGDTAAAAGAGQAGSSASAGAGGTTATGAGGTSATGGGSTGGTSAGGTSASSNVIAMALFHPLDVQIYGTDVYWSTQGAGINKIPIAGGKPTQIVTDSAPHAIAVDATGIYWNTGDTAIMHAGLDGSNPTKIATIDGFTGSKLGLVGTQLYFGGKVGAATGILTVATSGGTPTPLYPNLAVNGLYVADATAGLVWQESQTSPPGIALMHAGLDGSNPTPITTIPTGSQQYLKGASTDGTSIFFGIRDQMPSPNQGYLYSAPAAGGAPTKTFTFTGELTDANGPYFGDNRTATAGIYQAGTDGTTETLISAATEANVRFLRTDATHLVWMSGDDSGQSRLHVVSR
jgi:hypothetical protein